MNNVIKAKLILSNLWGQAFSINDDWTATDYYLYNYKLYLSYNDWTFEPISQKVLAIYIIDDYDKIKLIATPEPLQDTPEEIENKF
jgi:hypothetical protein